jgi:hypothetical protein
MKPTRPGRIVTWSVKAWPPAPSGGNWPCTSSPQTGRYAFVDASGALSSGEYNEGRLVTRMPDRGVRLEKPNYRWGAVAIRLAAPVAVQVEPSLAARATDQGAVVLARHAADCCFPGPTSSF